MRFVYYNIVSLALILLSGFLAYNKISGWGWVVFGALCATVIPTNKKE